VGRELAVGVVAFAAGLALGLLLRGDPAPPERPSPAEIRPSTDPPAASPREPTRHPRETSAQDAADTARAASAAPVPLSNDVREIPLPDAPQCLADVDVEVVDAEGRPVGNATVYALRVGAPGVEDASDVPNAVSGADGRCRLRIPAPGTFDVAAVHERALGRVENVAVPRGSGVRVVVPPHADVVFVADPSAPIGIEFGLEVAGATSGGEHDWPARGEPHRHFASEQLSAGFTSDTWSLPAGAKFVASSRQDVEFDPPEFTAPATVVVRPVAGRAARELNVRLALAGDASRWARDRSVRYVLEFDDGGRGEGVARLFVGEAPFKTNRTELVRAERGTVKWSGPELAPGSAAWDLGVSRDVDVRFDVLDPPPDAARGVRLLVDLRSERADESGMTRVYFDDGDDDPSDVASGKVRAGEETTIDVPGDWIVVDVGEYTNDHEHRLVAGPARLSRGERMTLRPRAGGFVVFTPSGVVSPSAGAVEIARADGAPFGSSTDSNVRWRLRCSAVPGLVLGPFEPGVVVLDVFVGGVRWGRYEVTVRADDHVPLTPRRFVGAPR